MNDEIKVGDRVKGKATGRKYVVLGIYRDMAWILHEETDMTSTVAFQYLTRIEPETVTLTPKYRIADSLRFKGGNRETAPIRVTGIIIGYLDEDNYFWREAELEPFPEQEITA